MFHFVKLKKNIVKIRRGIRSRKILHLTWGTLYDFYNDDCLTLAASISFYFLLSFIPFLIILGALLGYSIEFIKDYYDITLVEIVSITKEYIQAIIPYLDDDILSGFFRIGDYKNSLGGIGGISLLISASLLFSSLHFSFFKIFGGKYINFIITRLISIVIIMMITMLAFFMHYFFGLIVSITTAIATKFTPAAFLYQFIKDHNYIASFIVTTLLIIMFFYVLLYFFTKDVSHSKMSVFLGSILFSVLWNIAKFSYEIYITQLASINIIYGSIAWMITAILWVYYSVIIFLLSMEFIKNLNIIRGKGVIKCS